VSETSKTADAAEWTTDPSNQAAIGAAGKATKDPVNEANVVVQNGAAHAQAISRMVMETVVNTAEAAASLSSRAAGQSQEIMLLGVRAAAGVGSRIADFNFGRSHHWLASAAQAMDIYRDAAERSAGRGQSLFASYMTFGRGLQTVQHAWLEMVDDTIEKAARKPRDLLHCNNVVELAEMQRDLYIDAINHAFESTGRLLDIAGRTSQDVVLPLRSHGH